MLLIDALIMRTYHECCYRQTMRKNFKYGRQRSRAEVGKQNVLKSQISLLSQYANRMSANFHDLSANRKSANTAS
jgi:hypothetical protein